MINTECGMHCPHCDLPVYNRASAGLLSPDGWAALLDRVLPVIKPDVVALAAREPLFDARTRAIVLRVLQTAKRYVSRSGLVSNGSNLNTFFQEMDARFRFDYMDLSLEGMREIDDKSRGPGHFELIERFLDQAEYKRHVDALYLSTTITAANSSTKHLTDYFYWVLDHMEKPNLALLLVYPNRFVPKALALKSDDVERVIELASSVSSKFSDIFLEVFPSSIPNLCGLVEDGVLPGDDEVLRDKAGVLCGYVAENLMIRYITPRDLMKYHLRISPEGVAMSSGGMEESDYLKGNYGNLMAEDLAVVQSRIACALEQERQNQPSGCPGRRCFRICRGSNNRCPVLQNIVKEVPHVRQACA